jgi:hypothetical protein
MQQDAEIQYSDFSYFHTKVVALFGLNFRRVSKLLSRYSLPSNKNKGVTQRFYLISTFTSVFRCYSSVTIQLEVLYVLVNINVIHIYECVMQY